MPKMLRVKATRQFSYHRAKDELLVEETKEVKALVKAGYYELIAVEETTEPKAEKAKAKPKAKDADEPKAE